MWWKKSPCWVKRGILMFPLIIIAGLVSYFLSAGKINLLFWAVIPSIIFEEAFEDCCYNISNNIVLNTIFIIIFWFLIGAIIGAIGFKLKKNLKK